MKYFSWVCINIQWKCLWHALFCIFCIAVGLCKGWASADNSCDDSPDSFRRFWEISLIQR